MPLYRIQHRRDTMQNWATVNPVLLDGELGCVTGEATLQFKMGDGITAWNDLPFCSGVDGRDGIQGRPGEAGEQGSAGPQGPQGERGVQGAKGDQGETPPISDSVISPDSGVSASSKAVKIAYDKGDEALAKANAVETSAVKKSGDTMTGDLVMGNNGNISFGSSTISPKIFFHGTSLAAGVQSSTLYLRTNGSIRFYKGGTHEPTAIPGEGGVEICSIADKSAVFNGSVKGTKFEGVATSADAATTAGKLTTARTIALSGAATGTATAFDGTKNIAISVTGLDVSKTIAGVLPVKFGGTGSATGVTPFPMPKTAAGVGQIISKSSNSSNKCILPAGGTWYWTIFSVGITGTGGSDRGAFITVPSGVSAGGENVGYGGVFTAWRIA